MRNALFERFHIGRVDSRDGALNVAQLLLNSVRRFANIVLTIQLQTSKNNQNIPQILTRETHLLEVVVEEGVVDANASLSLVNELGTLRAHRVGKLTDRLALAT